MTCPSFPCCASYTFSEGDSSATSSEEEDKNEYGRQTLSLEPPIYRPSFDATQRPPEMTTRLSLERPSLDLLHHHGPQTVKDKWKTLFLLSFNTLGVIYGDIGTSPLYVLKTVFSEADATDRNIIGSISLVIWVVFVLVTIKYITLILRADNKGEGGTFALLGLLNGEETPDSSIDVEETGHGLKNLSEPTAINLDQEPKKKENCGRKSFPLFLLSRLLLY
jgi:hypothetical protein